MIIFKPFLHSQMTHNIFVIIIETAAAIFRVKSIAVRS